MYRLGSVKQRPRTGKHRQSTSQLFNDIGILLFFNFWDGHRPSGLLGVNASVFAGDPLEGQTKTNQNKQKIGRRCMDSDGHFLV